MISRLSRVGDMSLIVRIIVALFNPTQISEALPLSLSTASTAPSEGEDDFGRQLPETSSGPLQVADLLGIVIEEDHPKQNTSQSVVEDISTLPTDRLPGTLPTMPNGIE